MWKATLLAASILAVPAHAYQPFTPQEEAQATKIPHANPKLGDVRCEVVETSYGYFSVNYELDFQSIRLTPRWVEFKILPLFHDSGITVLTHRYATDGIVQDDPAYFFAHTQFFITSTSDTSIPRAKALNGRWAMIATDNLHRSCVFRIRGDRRYRVKDEGPERFGSGPRLSASLPGLGCGARAG